MSVAVVTDSTAYLPRELVEQYGIEVVPLYVVLPGRSGREGRDVGPQEVAAALAGRGQQVKTSRPTPGDFVAAYRRCLDAGASRIVSVHLSSELSGTWDAARLAAAQVGEHVVTVIDSRATAMATGFAVLAAALVEGRATQRDDLEPTGVEFGTKSGPGAALYGEGGGERGWQPEVHAEQVGAEAGPGRAVRVELRDNVR